MGRFFQTVFEGVGIIVRRDGAAYPQETAAS
jgi:hypothetical protein